jgi:hypothetical protein
MLNELAKLLPQNPRSFREAITSAEEILKQSPQVHLDVAHHFSKGVYARQILMPKGLIITGQVHKTEHLCIMNGDIDIADENGNFRYTGYHVFNSKPGIKRILATHEDTSFTTIHITEETDLDKLEKALVVETYKEYEQQQLAATYREVLP